MNQINSISEVLELAANSTCVLCQRPTAVGGSLTLDNAEKFGAEPGKPSILFYGSCEACARDPDFEATV